MLNTEPSSENKSAVIELFRGSCRGNSLRRARSTHPLVGPFRCARPVKDRL
jgi:hypothetical protein